MRPVTRKTLALAILVCGLCLVFAIANHGNLYRCRETSFQDDCFVSNKPDVDYSSRDLMPEAREITVEQSFLGDVRDEMERNGAWGLVDFQVKDRMGNAVVDANIHLYFTQPHVDDPAGRLEGKTDSFGCFSAKKKTTYACLWQVYKEGYYESFGKVEFSPHFSLKSARNHQWTESPLKVDVILNEISPVKLLHGIRYWKDIPMPTNIWVGFDFEKCDCVQPYGSGTVTNILLLTGGTGYQGKAMSPDTPWTNVCRIAAPGGGVALQNENMQSKMPFLYEAPLHIVTTEIEFSFVRTREKVLLDNRMADGTYMVFQTIPSSRNGKSHFGILRKLEFWPEGLRFEYFYNAKPEDRRIAADISTPWDIGR